MQTDLSALLAQLVSGRANGDPMAQLRSTLLARLAERSPDDPLRAMVSQFVTPPERRGASSGSDGADLGQMRALLQAAGDELKRLHERQRALAAALGACPECWGSEQSCPHCGGHGRPGWAQPHPTAFAAWVEPALQMVRDSIAECGESGAVAKPAEADHVIQLARKKARREVNDVDT